jgi:hypothetical protein
MKKLLKIMAYRSCASMDLVALADVLTGEKEKIYN